MNILIVDNGTSYLPQLKRVLGDNNTTVIEYSKISLLDNNDYDAIILSGGHTFPVAHDEGRLDKEVELIVNSGKPVFGICFGFELIARIFGAKLRFLQEKEKGLIDIEIVSQDKIFLNVPNFKVFESHRWVVEESGESELIVLARSKDGVEMIKHKTKPIYGSQFHPEMFVDETCGDEILMNFLKLAV